MRLVKRYGSEEGENRKTRLTRFRAGNPLAAPSTAPVALAGLLSAPVPLLPLDCPAALIPFAISAVVCGPGPASPIPVPSPSPSTFILVGLAGPVLTGVPSSFVSSAPGADDRFRLFGGSTKVQAMCMALHATHGSPIVWKHRRLAVRPGKSRREERVKRYERSVARWKVSDGSQTARTLMGCGRGEGVRRQS